MELTLYLFIISRLGLLVNLEVYFKVENGSHHVTNGNLPFYDVNVSTSPPDVSREQRRLCSGSASAQVCSGLLTLPKRPLFP
jgi:hypothetical protein